MEFSFTPAEISGITQPKQARGDSGRSIGGIASLADAQPGDLSFLSHAKYKASVLACRASIILVPLDYVGEPAPGQQLLLVEQPSVALARVCARVEQLLWPRPTPGIDPSAQVAPGANVSPTATVGPLCVIEAGVVIGERAHLQAQVFVGRGARVGEDCWLMPHVVLAAECELGRRVRLQPGVVVGSDGFGYEFVAGRHEKIPQVGSVVLGDDVEIGANTTIDRARFARTVIGEGTKIDNLVQIAHNVVIGRHAILCAQVGISGSTTIGDYVVLGGQAGAAGHLTIGRAAKAGGRAAIVSDIAPGAFVNGNPAIPYLLERRIAVLSQRLPDLFRRVDKLTAELEDLKKSSA